MSPLLDELLRLAYNTPGRQAWRDSLSDWILERTLTGQPLKARDLLDGLFLFQPSLVNRAFERGDLRSALTALLDTDRATTATRPEL